MRRMLLLVAALAALAAALASASPAARNAPATNGYVWNAALVHQEGGAVCSTSSMPRCEFTVIVSTGARIPTVQVNNVAYLTQLCGWLYPSRSYICQDFSWAENIAVASPSSTGSLYKIQVQARRACPTGGGYHRSEIKSWTEVFGIDTTIDWEDLTIASSGCQPT